MLRSEPLKDSWAEQRLFNNRTIWAIAGLLLLTGVLGTRLVKLQVVDFQHYSELSYGNRVRIEALAPIRGIIYDRNGVVLAENLPAWQLVLIPEQVSNIERTLDELKAMGLLNDEHREGFERRRRGKRAFDAIPLRFRLTDEELAKFSVHRHEFPGVEFQPALVRRYPQGALGVHALGYLGAISEADLERLDQKEYAATSHIGKTGVEREYEYLLHGSPGNRQLMVNAQGRQVEPRADTAGELEKNRNDPAPGDDLILSLDSRLQSVAEEALGERRGAVVAIDVRNGDILALVSLPGFDPNVFSAGGLSQQDFLALQNNVDKPLFNRALRGTYPPGSTVKPFIALAGLDYRATHPDQAIYCHGYYQIPGNAHRYRDWKPEGHGMTDLNDAIAESCDVYFYQLAMELGINRMHAMMQEFGFGEPTGVDLPGEKSGLMPSRDWKRRAFSSRPDQVWFPGETVITGIGQGYMLATPLQLAHTTATLAMRGQGFIPRIVTAYRNPLTEETIKFEPVPLTPIEVNNEAHWEFVRNAMANVMRGPRGTARAAAQGAAYTIAGKSGTAQVFSVGQEEEYDAEEIDERLRHHALFVAFAPVEDPQISVAVLVENGGGGSSTAAPVARAVLDAWFEMQQP